MDGRDYYCIGIVQTWLRTEVVPFACMPVCMHMLCMDCIDPLLPVPILYVLDSIPKRVVCIFYLRFIFYLFYKIPVVTCRVGWPERVYIGIACVEI